MLIIKCNNCDARFPGAPELAGEQVECPYCGAHIRVPFDAPDLDAIKQRVEPRSDVSTPATSHVVEVGDGSHDQEKDTVVIQAAADDPHAGQLGQPDVLFEHLENLQKGLRTLGAGLHTVSLQLLFLMLMVAALLLCIIVLTIGVWAG